MRQQCSVCGIRDKDGGRDRGLLKLKPVMLERLGIRKDCTYYVCCCSYELEAVTLGKRRRWTDDAKLDIEISNIVKESDTESVAKDHAYLRDDDEEEEEDDFSQRALDLKMGSDEFNDSGLIDCIEETVEAENTATSSSQCSLSQSEADSEDSYCPPSQEESGELSQLSQLSSSAGKDNLPDYLLVSTTRLLQLLRRQCLTAGCRALVEEDIGLSLQGAAVTAKLCCMDNHNNSWSTDSFYDKLSPLGRQRSKLNVRLSTYLQLTGTNYDPIKTLFDHLSVPFIGKSGHYKFLKSHVNPSIWSSWVLEQNKTLETMKEDKAAGKKLIAIGDARHDSPGYTAAFGTYIVMDPDSGRVITFYVVHKDQVSSSSVMEVSGAKTVLEFLRGRGVFLDRFGTDRSPSIRAMLAREFPEIDHQFDGWHFIKNVEKPLWKSKDKLIEAWFTAIVRHLWWALKSSIGNPDLARDKILSLFFHVQGVHEFPHLVHFPACEHGELEDLRPWVPAGSKSMKKIEMAVHGKNKHNLQDLPHLQHFIHTYKVENFNSMLTLVYTPKAYSYSWETMFIRTALACRDQNRNCGRKQKLLATGQPAYTVKVNRARTKECAVKVKAPKDHSWRDEIFQMVDKSCKTGLVPACRPPVVQHLRPARETLGKVALVDRQVSRLGKS